MAGRRSIHWYGIIVFSLAMLFGSMSRAESASVLWSHTRGLVEAPFELTLTVEPPEGTIRYTIDGSVPSLDSGMVYSEPLRIDQTTVLRVIGSHEDDVSLVATHSFLFLQQVKDQEKFPDGYLTEIQSARNGSNRPHTFDWSMDPEVLNKLPGNGDLSPYLNDLPSLSIVMPIADLNFVYENHTRRGVRYERGTSLELIYPNSDQYADFEGVQVDCGIRMQGGGAVDQARKKSFRILFKKDYGAGTLKYPLFESAAHFGGNAASGFEGVTLRAGGNTNWSKDDAWKHEPSTYLRDPLVRDSQLAISGMGSRSIFAHCYINGLYFGLYNMAERPDAKFMASYLGGEVEDYYSINHGGSVEGDSSRWNDSIRSSKLNGLDQPSRYDAIQERIDTEAFSDYVLLNWLVGMGDWPHNNFYAGIRNDPPGRIQYFAWDSEYAFWTIEGYLGSNPTAWVHPRFRSTNTTITKLWIALAANPDFLMTFADRVHRHCFNEGPLTDKNLKERFQRLAASIEDAIVAESARWGDSAWGRENNPHTRENTFIPNRDAVVDLIDGNVATFVSALRKQGFYPDLDPPQILTDTESNGTTTAISMTNPNPTGLIYYTLNGEDPRLSGGALSPSAIPYEMNSSSITISEAIRLKARVLQPSVSGNSEWSALREQFFQSSSVGFPLRITELMYHPKDSEALEFVELSNVRSASLDLTGFYVRGIDYRFPPGSRLEAHQTIVLIPNDDPAAFAATYPNLSVFGTYRRHLANDGEEIRIYDGYDRLITSVAYDDNPETLWPETPDGQGYSLEAVDLLVAGTTPSDWRPSAEPGGTPGVAIPGIASPVDSDGDELDDWAEVKAGTDPNDPSDFLGIQIDRAEVGSVRLQFNPVPGRTYSIQSKQSLHDGEWQILRRFPHDDPDRTDPINAIIEMNGEHLFFRVAIE
jgi:hypothetical protein